MRETLKNKTGFYFRPMAPIAVAAALVAPLYAYSQGQFPNQRRNSGAGSAVTTYKPEVDIDVRDGYRFIAANGIPDHPTGQFPNRGNPNSIAPQDYRFRLPLEPKPNTGNPARGQIFGVAVNGVVFDPGTAELWNGDFRWRYEALTGFMALQGSLGADANFAHVQPNGAYHYHGLPMGLLKKLDYTRKMALVGWAADGYPIYGPYGYADANDPKSRLKLLKPSYRLKGGERPGSASGGDGPGGAYDGSFEQDYEFARGAGDLDEFNGRFGVTPEYPKGTFYYVLTDTWPFVPRRFKGAPDASFQKGGPGGPGRPGGGPPGFGGPGGGPGGPPPGRFPGRFPGGRRPGPPPPFGPPPGGE
jgi:hypothetical protein